MSNCVVTAAIAPNRIGHATRRKRDRRWWLVRHTAVQGGNIGFLFGLSSRFLLVIFVVLCCEPLRR